MSLVWTYLIALYNDCNGPSIHMQIILIPDCEVSACVTYVWKVVFSHCVVVTIVKYLFMYLSFEICLRLLQTSAFMQAEKPFEILLNAILVDPLFWT